MREPDASQPRRAAAVVGALVVLNLFGFALELNAAAGEGGTARLEALFDTWALIPREFLRGVFQPGTTRQWVWLTPLSSLFLHAGPLHLVGNLAGLWIFGRPVEAALGHGRFALLYAASGLAAAALHVASAPASHVASVGASGAVAGVLGATLRLRPPARTAHRVLAGLALLGWLALPLAVAGGRWSPETGVAAWAHVGGLLAGWGLAGRLRRGAPGSRPGAGGSP